jgi:Mg2+ and Co2+ transporter CorA
MPELEWEWGYTLAWGSMLATATAMVIWFRHKKWL